MIDSSEIYKEYDNVKFILREKAHPLRLSNIDMPHNLYIWHDLANEYIFECSVKDESYALEVIKKLKKHGFI